MTESADRLRQAKQDVSAQFDSVRRRWRTAHILIGCALGAAVMLIALIVASYHLDTVRFSQDSLSALRWGLSLTLAAIVGLLLWRALRPVSEHWVARYAEHHSQDTDALLLSAAEANARAELPAAESASLTARLLQRATHVLGSEQPGARHEIKRRGWALGSVGMLALTALLTYKLATPGQQHAAALLVLNLPEASHPGPYQITVTPGDAPAIFGENKRISAQLHGFATDKVTLRSRPIGSGDDASTDSRTHARASIDASPDSQWTEVIMHRRADGQAFEALLTRLSADREYFVQADGVRSPTYAVSVTRLPKVARIDVQYHFPTYTGRPPERVADATEIRALKGTRVELTVQLDLPAAGGQLVVDGETAAELRTTLPTPKLAADMAPEKSVQLAGQNGTGTVDDTATINNAATTSESNAAPGTRNPGQTNPGQTNPGQTGTSAADSWQAELHVREDGQFRIDLVAPDGKDVAASPEMPIVALVDEPARIHIAQPGRDTKVTSVEEIEILTEAADDTALRQLDLVVSINGRAEQTISLLDRPADNAELFSHVMLMEERKLEPGDLVAYYVRANDDLRNASRSVQSDIFFMEVRPFEKRFRRASGGGGSGSGRGGQSEEILAAQQRALVIALFNLIRDYERADQEARREQLNVLMDAQARIRTRTEAIVRRTNMRAMMRSNKAFERMAAELPLALSAMALVESELAVEQPAKALPSAREALAHLQRADAAFRDVQVQAQRNRSGGGGNQSAEDLSNLFKLEMDKFRSQYAHVQRGRQRNNQQQVDEAIKRLKELAERQQREARRAGQHGTDNQQALADAVEELIRKLERLSAKDDDQQVAAALDQLRKAAKAMRQAAQSGSESQTADNSRSRPGRRDGSGSPGGQNSGSQQLSADNSRGNSAPDTTPGQPRSQGVAKEADSPKDDRKRTASSGAPENKLAGPDTPADANAAGSTRSNSASTGERKMQQSGNSTSREGASPELMRERAKREALAALRNAEQALRSAESARFAQAVQSSLRDAEALANRQRQIDTLINAPRDTPGDPSGGSSGVSSGKAGTNATLSPSQIAEIVAAKDEMLATAEALGEKLSELAREKGSNPKSSAHVRRSAQALRDGRTAQRLRWTRQAFEQDPGDAKPKMEQAIARAVTRARDELRDAVAALTPGAGNQRAVPAPLSDVARQLAELKRATREANARQSGRAGSAGGRQAGTGGVQNGGVHNGRGLGGGGLIDVPRITAGMRQSSDELSRMRGTLIDRGHTAADIDRLVSALDQIAGEATPFERTIDAALLLAQKLAEEAQPDTNASEAPGGQPRLAAHGRLPPELRSISERYSKELSESSSL